MTQKKLKVVELFAGVGGFRLGLEETGKFEVIWSNQWEPDKNVQHASNIYVNHWGKKNHTCKDIKKVSIDEIPEHDVLVGGFPCQDYSVASLLKNSQGLYGKKGVLWWEIFRILNEIKKKPKYLILENVSRLLQSPANQRGRDFAVMLKSLDELGYAAEWRVIKASDYGYPQKRKRIFILGYHKDSEIYKKINTAEDDFPKKWLFQDGIFAQQFKVEATNKLLLDSFSLDGDRVKVSKMFNKNYQEYKFENMGFLYNNKIWTDQPKEKFEGPFKLLKDVIEKKEVDTNFYIMKKDLKKWKVAKGAKKKTRTTKEGFEYVWSEGNINFPDDLNSPSRTIITSEGGSSPSRIKHVIETKDGRKRRLIPIELERLNGFPENHTLLEGVSDNMRAFLMGNALVVGIVTQIGKSLYKNN